MFGIAQGTTWTSPTGEFAGSGSLSWYFNGPSGVTVDSSGNIYVTDNKNYRVQIFNSAGAFVRGFGAATTWTGTAPSTPTGTSNGYFKFSVGSYPDFEGLAVDSSGNIYVNDSYNYRIQIFNSAGTFVRGIGSGTTWTGSAPTPTRYNASGVQANSYFYDPKDVTLDSSGNIYVADMQSYRIQVFNSAGTFIRGFGAATTWTGTAPTPNSTPIWGDTSGAIGYYIPYGVDVDSSGNIYVADANYYRVQIFNSAGTFVRGIGSGTTWTTEPVSTCTSTGNGWFKNPVGAALDSTGNIYIADDGNHRIQIFNAAGAFVRGIGSGTTWTGTAPAVANGTLNSYFYSPRGVSVDSSGNIYVGDFSNYRIQVFNSAGAFVRGIGSGTVWTGAAPTVLATPSNGYFYNPDGVAVDSSGNLYVADRSNQRIMIHNSAGAFVRGIANGSTWASPTAAPYADGYGCPCPIASGSANSYFSSPQGIATDSSGNIYVSESGNSRLQIFNSAGAFVRGIGSGTVWTGAAPTPDSGYKQNYYFAGPYEVAIDDSNNIYVADASDFRVGIFDASGTFVRGIGWGTVWTGDAPTSIALRGYRTNFFNNNPGIAVGPAGYYSTGTLGGASSGNIGLRFDAGTGAKVRLSTLSWSHTFPTGSTSSCAVKFKIRAADTSDGLDAATWYGPGGATTGSDWSTAGAYFGQIYGSSATSGAIPAAIGSVRFAEVLVRLETDGSKTPTLDDVTLTYDTLDAPSTVNMKQYKTDEITLISDGGYTNQSSAVLKVEGVSGLADSTSLRAEFEVLPTSSSFTNSGSNGSIQVGGISSYTTTGLVSGSIYKWQARIKDAEGRISTWTEYPNNNPAFRCDTTAPTVSSVSSSTANGSYKAGDSIVITVNFTEAVTVNTGGGSPLLTLNTGGPNPNATYSSGSGTSTLNFNYTVQAGDTSSDLDYVATTSLTLNGGTIKDAASNDATLTLAIPGASGSLGANKNIVIDTTAPTVTASPGVSSSTANGSYKAGDQIAVTVNFSETVYVVTTGGTPTITLETGTIDRVGSYSAGSGSTTLTFTYTVQAGDASSDLDYTATTSLALNGGTIKDLAGNNATLTLATPGQAGSLSANKAIVIDTTPPTVSSVSATTADGYYTTGNTIAVTVAFSKTVNVTGTPTLTLETGTPDRTASYASGTGTTTLTFNYTVQAGDNSADLDYVATTSLALNGGTIKDAAGNDATLTLATPGAANSLGANRNIVIDTTAPSGSITAPTDAGYVNSTQPTFTVSASDSGSGVASVLFQYKLTAAPTYTDLNTDTSSPYAAVWGIVNLSDASSYNLRAVITDNAGSQTTLTAISTTVDTTAPSGSITAPNDGAFVSTTPPTFTVSASDTLSGVASVQFQYKLSTAGTYTNLNTDTSSPYAADWGVVTLTDGSSYNLRAVITDTAGNTNTLTAITITCDANVPTVDSVSSSTANGSYNAGDTIAVTVAFSKTVYVVTTGGTPYITLETGSTDRNASYASGSGSSTLTFNYTVQAGDTSSDLDYVAITSLALNGGTIKTVSGMDATLTLPAPGATGSLGANKAIVIDTTAPTISNVSSSSANGSYKLADIIPINITFSEAVNVVTTGGTPTITLNSVSGGRSVTYSSGTGTNTLTFNYTVQSTDSSSDLDYLATTSLALNSGTIKDAAENDATLTLPAPGAAGSLGANKALVVDGYVPSGGSISYTDGVTQSTSATITLNEGTDTGTGIASRVLERAVADYRNDAVGTYGSWSSVQTVAQGTLTYTDTVTAGFAYKYRYVVTDNAGNATTYTSASEVKVISTTSAYSLNDVTSLTAGDRAAYTLTRKDQYGNTVTFGAETLYLYTNSTGSNAAFKNASSGGSTIITTTISSGSGTASFWYYDDKAGSWTVTVSDASPADSTVGIDDATDALTVNPAASSKLKVTAASSTMAAGASKTITITAYDTYSNVTTAYSGQKSVVFSGANASTSPVTNPTCSDDTAVDRNFSVATLITFTSGVATSTMKLYKAETATIAAAISADSLTTATADRLSVTVTNGTATKLSWGTQYGSGDKVVANAPWKTFTVNVTDAYGNTASTSAVDVTVTPTGGTTTASLTSTVASSSGVSTFSNYGAYCSSYPGSVTLVASATGLTSTSASTAVIVEENYTLNWTVKDSVTAAQLAAVTLTAYNSAGTVVYGPTTENGSFTSILLPYGGADGYSFDFTKEGYVTDTQAKAPSSAEDGVDGAYDNTISWIYYMTSIQESLADYKVLSSFVYTEATTDTNGDLVSGTDQLIIRTWLERRGKLVVNTDINKLRGATVEIYNDTTGAWTTVTFDDITDDSASPEAERNGTYLVTIPHVTTEGTGKVLSLTAGKTYFAKCNITWGGSSSATRRTYTGGTTFTIQVTERINELVTDIANLSTQISTEVSGLSTTVSTEAATTRTKITSEATTTRTSVAGVKTDTTSILTATGTTSLPDQIEAVTTQIETDIEPQVKSAILTRDTVVKKGDTITIRYRTTTGLSPTMTVYDPNNVVRLSGAIMTEIATSGIYEYDVKFLSTWPVGDYSVVCSESTQGTIDAITITVASTDIEDISSNVSAVLGSVGQVKDFQNQIQAFTAAFNVVEENIRKASIALAGVQAGTQQAVEASEQLGSLFSTMKEMSAKIKALGGTAGYDLERLYEVSESRSKDIGYIRNKTQELKAIMLLNQKMMESTAKEEPVVQTWFEYR